MMSSKSMERILQGVIQYRNVYKQKVVEELQNLSNKTPARKPEALYITCMDCRLLPSIMTQTQPGDMYVVRNAGNLVPHSEHCDLKSHPSCEVAALDLCCNVAQIGNVIVSGHSNCKAVSKLNELLYSKQGPEPVDPLHLFLQKYGATSLMKMEQLLNSPKKQGPIQFNLMSQRKNFRAFIDPEDELSDLDKLSQVNTLQQLENISSLKFLEDHLNKGIVNLHAWWFHLDTGDYHVFSLKDERFIPLTDANAKEVLGIAGTSPA